MHAGFQAPAPGLYSTAARGKVWSVLKKLKVAVLFGGASSEHEVSRMSATSVLNNLDTEKYDVLPVGITKDGRWYLYSGPVEDLCSGAWERHSGNVPAAICPGSGLAGLVAFENGVCRSLPVDVVFPVLHGKNGEDGTIQGLLELAGLPYVGCGVLGSAVCMDKIIANRVMDATGIPRCEWDCMERWQRPELAAIARRAAEKLGWPIFVKPANAGSSVGISKARDMAELEAAVDLALQHDSRVVFERFVQGQEVECAVRGNDEVSGTHPGEILASAEFTPTMTNTSPAPAGWPSRRSLRRKSWTRCGTWPCAPTGRCAAKVWPAWTFLWSTAHSACCSTRSTPCRALPASACIPS